jgi:hypothetical protein
VAIVVGWAAYLLPQWLRRRETLSQSRGSDRHSAGLRVLDRRIRATGGRSSVPLLPDADTLRTRSVVGASSADRTVEAESRRPVDNVRRHGSAVTPAGADRSSARVAARRRARVLTVLLALTGVAWVVSVPVPAVTVAAVAASVLLVLDVVALVVTARRRAVRRSVARTHRRELDRRRAVVARRRRAVPAGIAPSAVSTSPIPTPAVADVVSRPGADAEPPAERVAREMAGGGTPWIPVPVPPPTYTLKPTAPRPEPAPLDLTPTPRPTEPGEPGADPAVARTPRPWDADRTFADDLDLDAVLARRRAVNG